MSYNQTGEQLLTAFYCKTREHKLEQAVMALMDNLNQLHIALHDQDLKENFANPDIACSCADAYRMGHEALKRD
jgi:hypothetical protein